MSYAGYTPPVAELPYEEVLWGEMKYFVYYFAGFLGYMVSYFRIFRSVIFLD